MSGGADWSIIRNPECRDGKHRNCNQEGWNEQADEPTDCPCECHSSSTEPLDNPTTEGLCKCWGGPCTLHAGHCCFGADTHEREDEHIVRGIAIYHQDLNP